MNKNPFFSIVIPFYNPGNLILNSIKSINNLIFRDFEVIFVDDGTNIDKNFVYDIIQKNANFEYQLITQNNQGNGFARNTGLRMAKGSWIVFLDCDDAISPSSLSEYSKAISNNDNLEMLCGQYLLVDGNKIGLFENQIVPSPPIIQLSSREASLLFLKRKIVILAPGTAYSRSFLEKNSVLFKSIRWSEDQLFVWECIFKAKHIGYLQVVNYHYLTNVDSSIMSSTKIDTMISAFPMFEDLEKQCQISKVKHCLAARWLLGTLHTVAARNDYEGYLKIYETCNAKKNIKKLISFKKIDVVVLSIVNTFFGKRALFKLLRRF